MANKDPIENPADGEEPSGQRDEPDFGDDSDEIEVSPAAWSRWNSEPMPALPKMAAVRRAFEACVADGLPKGFAWALARAVTDPASLRAALGAKRSMPVVGGKFEFIELDLWTPAVSPMVTNHRAFAERVYPASGAQGVLGPLHGPTSEYGVTSTLHTRARDVPHVLAEAERARNFVLADNKLAASIAERGIMMPIDVVYNEIHHGDGEPDAGLLVTAEGSCRITNAHEVLGITGAGTVMYDLPADNDRLRRQIGSILTEDPDEPSLTERAAAKMRGRRNALIVRARVIVRFVPTQASSYDFAQALGGYLGMLHVDGPRPWPVTGRNEAMAESVVRALRHHEAITEQEHDYIAGLMEPAVAIEHGFPGEADTQAAYVIATLLNPAFRPIVSRAIRDVTSASQASAEAKAETAAELALRPIRSLATSLPPGDPARRQIDSMQAAYRRACRLKLYASGGWKVTGREPGQLLVDAMAELRASANAPTGAGDYSARTELAALAQFHLTRWGCLRREPHGSGGTANDKRGPGDVLRAMVEDAQGLHLLHQAIVDGRAGRMPRIVDEKGHLVRGDLSDNGALVVDAAGEEVGVSDQWLRYDAFPRPGVDRPMPMPPSTELPDRALARLKQAVKLALDRLEEQVESIEELTDGSSIPLIEMQGWATDGLLQRLEDVRKRLSFWDGLASRMARRARADDEAE